MIVEWMGKKRVEMIRNAWDAQKEIREVVVFLQGHGVSSPYAAKIYSNTEKIPFRLSRRTPTDSQPISSASALKLLIRLLAIWELAGTPKFGLKRESFILQERADDGHVYYPYEPLIEACEKILEVDKEIKALAKLFEERKIVLEDIIEKLRSRVPHDDILDHLKVKDRSQLW